MADYTLTHTGAEVDSAVTKGLLIPTPASSSDAGKVPTVNSSGTGYELATQAGMANPMTTAGDIIYGGSSGTPTRLAKGTAGQVLKMNSGATAPEWVTPISYVEVVNGYTVTVINNSGYTVTIYDGADSAGTLIGNLSNASTETYTITSGNIYTNNPNLYFTEAPTAPSNNPYPISSNMRLYLVAGGSNL